jgi:two-component system chemotaxis response regulator CheY
MDNGIETHHNAGACADQRVGRRAGALPARLVGGTASAQHDDAMPGRRRFMTMRRVLRKPLHEMGLEPVDEAASGERPTIDGFDLLATIKKDPRLRHTPVLIVAAEPREDEIVRAVQAGAGGVLVEPSTRAVLEERLCQIAPDLFLQA